MTSDHLKHVIDDLHQALDGHALDDEDRDVLRRALHDIGDALATDAPATGDTGDAGAPMTPSAIDGLDEMAYRFREEHPTLATGIQRLIDLLNQSGI